MTLLGKRWPGFENTGYSLAHLRVESPPLVDTKTSRISTPAAASPSAGPDSRLRERFNNQISAKGSAKRLPRSVTMDARFRRTTFTSVERRRRACAARRRSSREKRLQGADAIWHESRIAPDVCQRRPRVRGPVLAPEGKAPWNKTSRACSKQPAKSYRPS